MHAHALDLTRLERAVTLHYIPPPLIRSAGEAQIWGTHGVVVSQPQPLRSEAFELRQAYEPKLLEPDLHPLLLLSSRLNRVHSQAYNGDFLLPVSAVEKAHKAIAPLSPADLRTTDALIASLTSAAGLQAPSLRSDRAWVAGRGPKEAVLVLPPVAVVDPLLANLLTTLSQHQSNCNEHLDEALAHQLLTIHPLADGNGRITRSLLIKLAARKRSLFPLYICWLLMFDKLATVASWNDASLTGQHTPEPARMERWLAAARALVSVWQEARKELDVRATDALLFTGAVTEDAVRAVSENCSPPLARRIASTYAASSLPSQRDLEEAIQTCIGTCKKLASPALKPPRTDGDS